jgi:hypothetical protein
VTVESAEDMENHTRIPHPPSSRSILVAILASIAPFVNGADDVKPEAIRPDQIVAEEQGEFLPPNQILFPNCFEGINADIRISYTIGATESDIILRENVMDRVAADPEFAGDDSVRLENWTEFVNPPKPRIVSRTVESE